MHVSNYRMEAEFFSTYALSWDDLHHTNTAHFAAGEIAAFQVRKHGAAYPRD